MAVPDINALSTEPSANVTLGSINIAENCPAANLNDAARYLAACVAVLKAAVPNSANYVTKTAGTFTENPTYSGQGGYLHNANSTAPGGAVYVLPAGSALPAGADGDLAIFYS